VHLWRQVSQQEGKSLVNGPGINCMVIIENEDELIRDVRIDSGSGC
jgi:hypothetical protein